MSWAAGCKPKIENKMKRIVLIAIMTMFLPDMNAQAQTASGTKVLVAYFSPVSYTHLTLPTNSRV